MAGSNFIVEDIKKVFRKGGNVGHQLILVNVFSFIFVHICGLFDTLGWSFPIEAFTYLMIMPGEVSELIFKPWTILTHGFTHIDLWHIFFNMLVLYWFSKLLAEVHPMKKILPIYIVGVLGGAAMFEIFNLFFPAPAGSQLMGASAGVFAVMTATGVLTPDRLISPFRLGPFALKYIVLAFVLIGTIIHFQANTGGKVAHMGGILVGYLYMSQYKQGKDITKWMDRIINSISNFSFKRKPKMRVVKNQPKPPRSDDQYRSNKVAQQKRIDQILDKINKSGWPSLSQEEKDFLANSNRD